MKYATKVFAFEGLFTITVELQRFPLEERQAGAKKLFNCLLDQMPKSTSSKWQMRLFYFSIHCRRMSNVFFQ